MQRVFFTAPIFASRIKPASACSGMEVHREVDVSPNIKRHQMQHQKGGSNSNINISGKRGQP